MVLNLSPLAAHLQESLTSLRFATKVGVESLNAMSFSHHLLPGQQHDNWNSQEIHSNFVMTVDG